MKVSTAIFIASAVVLASTIYARPALLKRAEYVLEAVACLTPQSAISDCQSKLGNDFGLAKGATAANIVFDLRSEHPTIASNDITVELMSFTGLSSFPVNRVKLNDGPHKTASFSSAWLTTTPKGFLVDIVLPSTPFTITAEETPAFIALLSTMATAESHTIVLSGTVDVDLTVFINDALDAFPKSLGLKVRSLLSKGVRINGLSVSTPLKIKGFNNLGGVIRGQLDTTSAVQTSASGERLIHGQIIVTSPADDLVELGAVDFQLWSKDAQPEYVGILSVANMSLGPGVGTYDVVVKVDAAVQLDKYFPVKTGLTLSVKGFAGSSKRPIAAGVVAAVKVDIVF
ncbi:hypothetical protein EMPS_11135 [Entomortierella parvispora]|uniref:Uncharacterized protein n=1 Tax=Entomortierella parvispora TaxID=205924 RepID=A0A9P3M1N8_9FUNG|nr:hypothetical protein EMPS_11135 [Entomortierella parvispora]